MGTHVSLEHCISHPAGESLQLAEMVEQGLPPESLGLLRAKGLTFTEMATVIAPRTLKHRKARGENLSPEESQRAVRVASIIGLAERVFGEPGKAMRWLREPDNRLDNRPPIDLLRTEAGGRLVESMLHGIDHGIFS